ncbi:MAG: dihydrodipicolinate synthase family protein [Acidobacteria bacterium]|nr:dihydrodipicolinate synthase family protein [Acidobacteriota bacterium]
MNLQGIIPILATPFHEDGSIDYDGQLRVVDHLLEQGAHGLAAFGNAGEGYTLLASEKRQLLDAIVKRVAGRAPVVVGVGVTGTEQAAEAAREAAGQGADALMVLPPYYLKPDADGVVFFFETVAKAAGIHVMIQDAPLLTGVPMPPPLIARMGREIEHVDSVKVEQPPTAPKVSKVCAAAGDSLTVLGGLNGQFMIEEIRRGARGQMPAADMTALYVAVWDALEAGDDERAWDVFTKMLPLVRFELQPGLGVSAVKHNLVARGVIESARVRHPTHSLDAAALAELAVLRRRVLET